MISSSAATTHHDEHKTLTALIAACLALGLCVSRLATTYMGLATFAYGLLLTGLYFRKNRPLHAGLMSSGIALDLAVVLSLELTKNAVKTALDFSLAPLQQAHVGVSSAAVLFYAPTVVIGALRYFGHRSAPARIWHLRFGMAALVLRTCGFLLMFSMLGRKG